MLKANYLVLAWLYCVISTSPLLASTTREGPSAVMAGNRLTVFLRGEQCGLNHTFYDQNINAWTGEYPLGNETITSAPSAVMAGNRLTVFVRKQNGVLTHKFYDSKAGRWTRWFDLGTEHISSSPSAVMAGNRLTVFARDANGNLTHKFYDSRRGGWTKWIGLKGARITSAPSAIMAGSRLTVFARNADGKLTHRYYDTKLSKWTDWIDLGEGRITSSPSVVMAGDRLTVFARTEKGLLTHKYYDPKIGRWTGWLHFNGGAISSSPSAVMAGDRLTVFARDMKGFLTHRFYDRKKNGWTGWSTFKINFANQKCHRICRNNQCLSLDKFENQLKSKFDGKVAGYSYVISHDSDGERMGGYGLARNTVNPPARDYSPFDRTIIGSVSKPVTTIATLRLLPRNRANLTLDSKIEPYLPKVWARGSGIDTITFRELMLHKSGIVPDLFPNYENSRQIVEAGIDVNNKKPLYRNIAFGLYQYIIPDMQGVGCGNSTSVVNPGECFANAYQDIMNAEVFSPAGIKRVACKPENPPPVLYYPFPSSGQSGRSAPDFSQSCAHGGLNMSMEELNHLARHLVDGQTLLTTTQRNEMLNNGFYLGIVSVRPSGISYQSGGQNNFDTETVQSRTSMIIFPDNVVVTTNINSPPPGNVFPEKLIQEAYETAWVSP